jgi:hypothetical protein
VTAKKYLHPVLRSQAGCGLVGAQQGEGAVS